MHRDIDTFDGAFTGLVEIAAAHYPWCGRDRMEHVLAITMDGFVYLKAQRVNPEEKEAEPRFRLLPDDEEVWGHIDPVMLDALGPDPYETELKMSDLVYAVGAYRDVRIGKWAAPRNPKR